jgi:hypothetical protein
VLATRGLIQAPAAVAWRLLTDTHEWPHWGPSVRAVECQTRLIGPDTRGKVQTALGLWLPFRITDWEPEQSWAWTVAGVPATCHRVIPFDAGTCEISFTVPAWAPFYLRVCKTAIRRINQRAAGYKQR